MHSPRRVDKIVIARQSFLVEDPKWTTKIPSDEALDDYFNAAVLFGQGKDEEARASASKGMAQIAKGLKQIRKLLEDPRAK